MMRPGPRNLITDVPGILVGNAQDGSIRSGTTVLTGDAPMVAGVHVMGGAPGTRETDLLAPDKTVQSVDALVLSGGSALGLSAASGVADALRARGRGFDVGGQNVPIVPAAIVFDLLNGGNKDWAENPYPDLGKAALADATRDFDLGSAGAGTGATTAGLMGGLGSASVELPSGATVGAIVVVNAVGSITIGDSPHFWSAPWEMGAEFGGLGLPDAFSPGLPPATKLSGPRENTTIAIVATDAALTKAQATRLATAAHDGLARSIVPSHTPYDGDLVFSVSTGNARQALPDDGLMELGHAAAVCLARAVARGVYHASDGILPSWKSKFG